MVLGRVVAAVTGVVALLLVLENAARPAEKSESEFIWISDIHFDPTANPELMSRLMDAAPGQWAAILQSAPGRPSAFKEDADWPLFASALTAMRKTAPHAQFTVVTGDIFVHQFRDKFNKTAQTQDPQAFSRFAQKTFEFAAAELETLAPGRPVLFALGNNDDDCGDYTLQPYGPFLRNTAPTINKMLGGVSNEASEIDWSDAGNYDVQHPSLTNVRVISLNSIFLSNRYKNACGISGDSDPGKEQMDWLAARLAHARANQNKVWLIFHIPPGIDAYATAHPKGGGEKTVVPMWKPEYTSRFQALLSQYQNTVMISLAGHEHMDDFRLIDHSLVLLAPALSPVASQNPAFRIAHFAPDGTVTDATTHYLSNLSGFDQGAQPSWKIEYSFGRACGMRALDFQAFNKLYEQIRIPGKTRTRWEKLYSVSHPADGITLQTFPWVYCAIGNASESDFSACVRQQQPK